jgi:hypothetical protein
MKIQIRQVKADQRDSQYSRFSGVVRAFLLLLFLTASFALLAQEGEQEKAAQQASEPKQLLTEVGQVPAEELVEELVEVTVILPDSQQMALALATTVLREQVLLDLASAANTLGRVQPGNEVDHAALAQNFLDDRAWLQMLVDSHGWVRPRSSILDPAAWRVIEELQEHNLEAMPLVFPGRTPEHVLMYQVFQRAGQRLAVANLPVLLFELEADAIATWDAFLQLTGPQESRDVAWKIVEETWFTDRQMPIPPILDDNSEGDSTKKDSARGDDTKTDKPEDDALLTQGIPETMSRLVVSAVDAGPPDDMGLVQLRYSILNDMQVLSGAESTSDRDQLRDFLYLASLVDGLHEGRYFDFTQGLLAITSRLLEHPMNAGSTYSLADWLVTELPAISAHYAVDFARVDPRLNAVMAVAYEVLLDISSYNHSVVNSDSGTENVSITGDDPATGTDPVAESDSDDPEESVNADHEVDTDPVIAALDVKTARAAIADAVAQLALLIPDMGYYFDTPVRARIVREINICMSVAASVDDAGKPTMTRIQFDACMEKMLQLADQETRLTELSGDMNGPFTTDTLRRELNVTPWQRINYGIGYLNEHYSTDCKPPARALPNPLEWAVLANTVTWFAEHSPEFFNSPENESRLTRLRSIGDQLIQALAEQSECLAANTAAINEPVKRVVTDYEQALRELDLGIRNAEADFREERLSPDADILLERDANQKTSYRPEGLLIKPCDANAVCEMSASLSTTRALIGLFSDEYLVAEQAGMGRIEICYRNMEWVQRRSELVRPDDENVSNYYGNLGFDLVGRYVENDRANDIFGFRFTSPEEYHYLFAQTSEDVLSDSCPVEWVGSRVVTPLRKSRGGIVPNRLTYLAASRKLPSRLMQNNWDRGAEWRDWFVTGIGVTPLEVPVSPEITTRLNQHLQSLYQAEQTEIYQRILLKNARNSQGDDVSLFDEMLEVSINKALVRMQMTLFYPDSLLNSDAIRMAVAGDSGLLDGRTLRRFREENIALTSVNGIAMERLKKAREAWSRQPEAVRRQGSVSGSLKHALTRINMLYRQFFISRPEPLQEIEVTVKPRGQDQPVKQPENG